jgi:hypothetical protein
MVLTNGKQAVRGKEFLSSTQFSNQFDHKVFRSRSPRVLDLRQRRDEQSVVVALIFPR